MQTAYSPINFKKKKKSYHIVISQLATVGI